MNLALAFIIGVLVTILFGHLVTGKGGSVSLSWGSWTGLWRLPGGKGEVRQWNIGWLTFSYLPFHVDDLIDAAASCPSAGVQRLSQEVGECMGGARRH